MRTITCPGCRHAFSQPEAVGEKLLRCPRCQRLVSLSSQIAVPAAGFALEANPNPAAAPDLPTDFATLKSSDVREAEKQRGQQQFLLFWLRLGVVAGAALGMAVGAAIGAAGLGSVQNFLSCLGGAVIGLFIAFVLAIGVGLLREERRGARTESIPLGGSAADLLQLFSLLLGSHAGPMGVLFVRLVLAGLVGATFGAYAGAEGMTPVLAWSPLLGALIGLPVGMVAALLAVRVVIRRQM